MAQVFLRTLLMLLCCSACSGSGCSDPPPGSPFETDGVEADLDECVGVTQGDEKTKGVVHQCKGDGTPKLFYTIECDGAFCPDTKRKQKNLDSFKFGAEDYDNASIAACCDEGAPAASVEGSCDKVCGVMLCDKMPQYVRFVRGDDQESKQMCCKTKEDGSFDCESDGQDVLGPCKILMGKWVTAMEDPSPKSEYGGLSWLDYCRSRAAIPSGLASDIPMKVDTGDQDEDGDVAEMKLAVQSALSTKRALAGELETRARTLEREPKTQEEAAQLRVQQRALQTRVRASEAELAQLDAP